MFSISNLGVQFTGTTLFSNISFLINGKDKIGLVGKNGVGKTTLLKIINGEQTPETGKVVIPQGKKVGYLPQELITGSTLSIRQEAISVFAEVRQLEEEIEQINHQLSSRKDYESEEYTQLITDVTEKSERLSLLDSSKMESQVERVLKGLGFLQADLERPLNEFSGGWQMRVELAKLLLLMPELLLLDEPTNHLDIESILWLEDFLKSYPGAIMMVSHDRMFLDHITNRTVEMVKGRIYDYKAAYSRFVQLREERLSQQEAAYINQQKHIAQQERFIERFRAKNTKAKQVQSKIKQLEKLEKVAFDEKDSQSIHFRFPPPPRSGDIVIEATEIGKSYGDNEVLKNLDFVINRGERITFVGRNGEGKSTLVKLITGEESYDGQLKIGHNVETGYYAQVQGSTMDENLTVYDTIDHVATGDMRTISKIRGLLGAFLFGADDIDKKVKVLSGGEKSRLALAKLLLHPVNLLILDEPTNHLDITAKEVLKNALMNYTGTLILVSHDRDFLQGLTNRTFVFGKKAIKDKLGDINDFLSSYELDSFRAFESLGSNNKTVEKPSGISANKKAYLKKKESKKSNKAAQTAVRKCENKIQKIEAEIKWIEEQMAQPDFYQDPEASQLVIGEHGKLKEKLAETMWEWEQLSTALDSDANES